MTGADDNKVPTPWPATDTNQTGDASLTEAQMPYVPPVVSAFKETVDGYFKEIWCDGKRTGSHTYPSQVTFRDADYNEYHLVGDAPTTHMGCGCWTGIEFILQPEPRTSLDFKFLAEQVEIASKILLKANAWIAEHGEPPVWGRDRSHEERRACAALPDLQHMVKIMNKLRQEDVHNLLGLNTMSSSEAG